MKTKEEIIEPFIWKDNNGNPRIAIMDCLNAMEIYADQFKQAGINTVLCTVASEEVVQNVSDRCVEYESGNSLCSVQCEMCKKL